MAESHSHSDPFMATGDMLLLCSPPHLSHYSPLSQASPARSHPELRALNSVGKSLPLGGIQGGGKSGCCEPLLEDKQHSPTTVALLIHSYSPHFLQLGHPSLLQALGPSMTPKGEVFFPTPLTLSPCDWPWPITSESTGQVPCPCRCG
jgi:hypothetical protein